MARKQSNPAIKTHKIDKKCQIWPIKLARKIKNDQKNKITTLKIAQK